MIESSPTQEAQLLDDIQAYLQTCSNEEKLELYNAAFNSELTMEDIDWEYTEPFAGEHKGAEGFEATEFGEEGDPEGFEATRFG